jgi:hypothetical protein
MEKDTSQKKSKQSGINKLVADLKDAAVNTPRLVVAVQQLDPQLVMLRTWQSDRLVHTYDDLLANPKFAPACRFFLSDIYGPRDYSQRDHDFEALHSVLSHFLPAFAIQLLTEALAANRAAYNLDMKLLQILIDQQNVTTHITVEQYVRGYRLCDNYVERAAQIEQITRVMCQVGELAHQSMVRPFLWAARQPALKGGWDELYGFLERGYTAYKGMKDRTLFTQILHDREMKILDRIYQGDPDPFYVGEMGV